MFFVFVFFMVRVVGCICPFQEQTEEGPKPPAFPPPKADMAQPVGLAGHPWKVLDREIFRLEVGILSKIKSLAEIGMSSDK